MDLVVLLPKWIFSSLSTVQLFDLVVHAVEGAHAYTVILILLTRLELQEQMMDAGQCTSPVECYQYTVGT